MLESLRQRDTDTTTRRSPRRAEPGNASCGSEGWWIVVRVVRRWWWFGWSQAGWAGGAGDPGRAGDVQGAVGFHAEGPAAGEGLQPVVGPAQAAQIRAGRAPALGVRRHVVEVGPAGPLSAVGR